MTKVAVRKGDCRRSNIKQALNAIHDDIAGNLSSAGSILIKVNLIDHVNQLASTHVDAVRGTLDYLREHTAAPIIIADSSYFCTKSAFRNFGYEVLPSEYENIALRDLNQEETHSGYFVKRDLSRGPLQLSKTATEADFRISLAPMKMHADAGVSLSLQNWSRGIWIPEAKFGASGKYWPRWTYLKDEGEWAYHMTLAEIFGQNKPNVGIIDAMMAMEGEGPTRGSGVPVGLSLAGTDCVAVDAVACGIMGVDPSEIGYLEFAAEKGYGIGDKDLINIDGKEQIAQTYLPLKKPGLWRDRALAWKDMGNLKFELPK